MAQTLTNMAAVRHVGLLLSAQQTIHHVTLIKGNFVSFGLIAFFIFQKFSLNGVRKESEDWMKCPFTSQKFGIWGVLTHKTS